MTSRIIGTGSSLPANIVTNDYLSTIMDTSDEWISSRTGIKERRLVKEETTASMAIEASLRAIEDAKISAEEIDLIIVATITADHITPSCACEVQAGIGAIHANAFDVNAACTGFMVAVNTAHAYLTMNMSSTALVIGVETLSKIMNWEDRSTCVLFGDGAGAAIMKKDEKGIISMVQGSDGAKGMVLAGKNRTNNNPLVQTSTELDYIKMDGQEVYKFAVKKVPDAIIKALAIANIDIHEVSYFILHQANIRIIHSVAKRLKIDVDKFPTTLERCGNVSAGSVPILLDEVNQKGMLKKGDIIVLAGFGGGLTWSADVIVW